MRIAFVAALVCLLWSGWALAQDASALKSQDDKVSYTIGLSVGKNLSVQGIEVDAEKFALGVRHGLQGSKALLSDQEVREVMQAYQARRQSEQMEAKNKATAANKKEGAAFMAANKKKKGVITTKSGLQYKVLTKGTGKQPTAASVVTAHYKGTLIDGTEFDSSHGRGQPAQFPVNGVIKGWSEVLQLMKVGSKWRVWIPPELGYGERGAGHSIGPDATLIFEIELIGVE